MLRARIVGCPRCGFIWLLNETWDSDVATCKMCETGVRYVVITKATQYYARWEDKPEMDALPEKDGKLMNRCPHCGSKNIFVPDGSEFWYCPTCKKTLEKYEDGE